MTTEYKNDILTTNDNILKLNKSDSTEMTDLISSFHNKREKAIMMLEANKDDRNLPFISGIEDQLVINLINKDQLIKDDISLFNGSRKDMLQGSAVAKRIVINIFNKIQANEFREETPEGEKIYLAFRELKRNININALKLNEEITCDEAIIRNSLYYLLIACETAVESPLELSQSLVDIFSSTNTQLSSIRDISVITEHNQKVLEDILQINKEALDEIAEIEKTKQSYIRWIGKGAYKLLKMTLVKDPLLAGCQLGIYSFVVIGTGNHLLGGIISKTYGKIKNGGVFTKDREIKKIRIMNQMNIT
jgi:predicted transcriptional regulator